MPAPVVFTFSGESAGAVKAAEATRGAFDTIAAAAREASTVATKAAAEQAAAIKETGTAAKSAADVAMEAARKAVAAAVAQRDELQRNVAAYRELAGAAKRGSDEQIQAARLASREVKLLRDMYLEAGDAAVVGARKAATAGKEGAAKSSEERGLLKGSTGLSGLGSTAFLGGAIGGLALKDILDETKRAQTSQALLQNALQQSGLTWAKNREEIDKTLDSQSKLSGFDRVDLRDALATILRGTHDLTKAQSETSIAIDVARGRHLALSAAAQLVTRAQLGNVGALRRLGIEAVASKKYQDELTNSHVKATPALKEQAKALDLAATKTQVMQALQKRYTGAAAAYSKTLEGHTAALSNSYRELEVEIGTALTPVLTKFTGWMAREIDMVRNSKTLHHELHDAFIAIKTAAGLAAAALHVAWDAVSAGVKAIGGTKNAVELLLAVLAANKMRSIAVGIVENLIGKGILLIGPSAIAAEGESVLAFGGIGLSAEALSMTIKSALITSGFGAVVVAVAIGVVEIVKHWDTVKKYLLDFGRFTENVFKAMWDGVKGLTDLAIYGLLFELDLWVKGIEKALGWIPGLGGKIKHALGEVDDFITSFRTNGIKDMQKAGDLMGSSWSDAFTTQVQGALQTVTTASAAAMAGMVGNQGAAVNSEAAMKGAHGMALAGTGGNAVAAAAASLAGVQYVWGGGHGSKPGPSHGTTGDSAEPNAPNMVGLDCSGYARAVLAKLGINLGGGTADALFRQANSHPSASDLQPGDLVFYEGAAHNHVMVYIGNGQVQGETHTGGGVQVVPVGYQAITGTGRYWAKKLSGGKTDKPAPPTTDTTTTPTTDAFAAALAAAAKAGAKKAPGQLTGVGKYVPASLTASISRMASKASGASGSAALGYIEKERADLEQAITDLRNAHPKTPAERAAITKAIASYQDKLDGLDKAASAAIEKSAVPQALQDQIKSLADKAKNSSGKIAASYLRKERDDYETAIADLQKAAKDPQLTASARAAIQKQIAEDRSKIADIGTAIKNALVVTGDALLPADLKRRVADSAAAAKAAVERSQAEVGKNQDAITAAVEADLQTAVTAYRDQASYLQQEAAGLQARLNRTTLPKQRAAISAEIKKVNAAIAAAGSNISSALQSEYQSLQQDVSNIQSRISGSLSSVAGVITQAFEAQTTAMEKQLGDQFLQNGQQTPAEALLASMQAQDSTQSLTDALTSAKDTLASDIAAAADAATLAADQKAVDAAQRSIDENNLSLQATAERTKADKDYADAVAKLTAQRTEEENQLNIVLQKFGVALGDGSASVGDLQGWLDGANQFGTNFGVNLGALTGASAVTKSYFDDLNGETQDLTTAMQNLQKVIDQITNQSSSGSASTSTGYGGQGGDAAASAAAVAVRQAIATTAAAAGKIMTKGAIPQANGGDWLVTKPTLFLAGEGGHERATFTPMGHPAAGQSGGGDVYNITVLGGTQRQVSNALARIVTPAQKRQVGFKTI